MEMEKGTHPFIITRSIMLRFLLLVTRTALLAVGVNSPSAYVDAIYC